MATRLSALAYQTLRNLPQAQLSAWMGASAMWTPPAAVARHVFPLAARLMGMNLEEAEVPAGGFANFDALFTRKLRPGARPAADQEGVLLAPADGRLEGCAPIAAGLAMRVKGQHFSLADLLADEAAAARLARGRYALIYLSPRDYHRVHAPVRGPVCACKHIPGALFPVNALGMRCVPQLFVSNERIVVQQQSKDFGLVCTVLVGAFAVGRIELCFPTSAQHEAPSQPAAQLQRGDEVGIFHLGSTVVVISEHAGHCDHRPLSDSIRVGQALWTQDAP